MKMLPFLFLFVCCLFSSTVRGQDANDFPDVRMAVPGDSNVADPEILVVVSTDRRTLAAYSSRTSSWDKITLPRALRKNEKPQLTAKFASIMVDNEAYAISSKMCRWIRLKLPQGNKAYLGSWATNMVFVSDRDSVFVLGENADKWTSFNAKTRAIQQ